MWWKDVPPPRWVVVVLLFCFYIRQQQRQRCVFCFSFASTVLPSYHALEVFSPAAAGDGGSSILVPRNNRRFRGRRGVFNVGGSCNCSEAGGATQLLVKRVERSGRCGDSGVVVAVGVPTLRSYWQHISKCGNVQMNFFAVHDRRKR